MRNWLWVIMHKYQMPWHFLSCQTIVFLSVYLQLMIEFHPLLPSHTNTPPKKKNKKTRKIEIPFLPWVCVCVCARVRACIPSTHTAAAGTHGSMHSKAYLQPLDGGPMETVLIISLLLQSTAVCFGIRGFLRRLHMHIHWLQARASEREREGAMGKEREGVLLLNNPPCTPHPPPRPHTRTAATITQSPTSSPRLAPPIPPPPPELPPHARHSSQSWEYYITLM